MPEGNFSGLLPVLKFNLRETEGDCGCGCAAFSNEELLLLLQKQLRAGRQLGKYSYRKQDENQ